MRGNVPAQSGPIPLFRETCRNFRPMGTWHDRAFSSSYHLFLPTVLSSFFFLVVAIKLSVPDSVVTCRFPLPRKRGERHRLGAAVSRSSVPVSPPALASHRNNEFRRAPRTRGMAAAGHASKTGDGRDRADKAYVGVSPSERETSAKYGRVLR